jgi:drug/metabolite transporter (DMT)-like permease
VTPGTANRAPAWAPWVALVVVYVVWGSTYMAIRVGVQTVPPFILAGVRYVLAGTLLYPVAVRMGGAQVRRADQPGSRQWLGAAIVGTLRALGGHPVAQACYRRRRIRAPAAGSTS